MPTHAGAEQRKTVRLTYPDKGIDALPSARDWAQDVLGRLRRGEDPSAAGDGSLTLRDALDLHLKRMRNKDASPAAVESITYSITHYAADLLDRDLATFTPEQMEALHDSISERGRSVANKTLRQIGTLFRTARRSPSYRAKLNPDILCLIEFHKQYRRQEPIEWPDLPAWFDAVDGVRNPVRRDLWLFILFTGLRRNDAKTVRWEHIDLDAGTIHRPKPKGGVDRAFTVPISSVMIDLLRHRQTENAELFGDDAGWVFPTTAKQGGRLVVTHVVEVKEQVYYRDAQGKQRKRQHPILKSPHRLRDTFSTATLEAGVTPIAQKILMNHRLPQADVTQGYQRPSLNFLRAEVEKTAAFLLERGGRSGYRGGSR